MSHKTILITGCSSGTGKACAQLFYQKGWHVMATMRYPEHEKDLKEDDRMTILRLDVNDKSSINTAIAAAIAKAGKIDVLFNNAGYGANGPVEAATDKAVLAKFQTNVFGLIHCIQAILPHFKQNKSGVIANMSTVGGLMTIPYMSIYASSKFAVEGFSEGLWYDLRNMGIQVKIIEPGGVTSDFFGRSLQRFDLTNFPEYKADNEIMLSNARYMKSYITPEEAARQIYAAIIDPSDKLRYIIGRLPKIMWFGRRLFGYKLQMKLTMRTLGLK